MGMFSSKVVMPVLAVLLLLAVYMAVQLGALALLVGNQESIGIMFGQKVSVVKVNKIMLLSMRVPLPVRQSS